MQEGWPVPIRQAHSRSPTLGDLDGDGKLEVGFIDDTGEQAWVHIWRSDGTYFPGWPQRIAFVSHSPTFGDLDGDGDLEVIIGAGHGVIKVWHHDGTYVEGWPVSVPYGTGVGVALGDIDGDHDIEVIIGGRNYVLFGFHHDGTPIDGWPLPIVDPGSSCPALGDLDGDGDVEVIEAAWHYRFYVWDCSGSYRPENIEWDMFHHDMWHTGLYGFNPSVGISENYMGESRKTFQNYPKPSDSKTQIEYQVLVDSHVALNIYNVTGRLVRTLLNEKVKAGKYQITWDGTDNAGIKVPSGIYFYQLKTPNHTSCDKIILLR